MKAKTTLILLLVAGALFVFIRIYEDRNPTTHEAEALAGLVFSDFDPESFNTLEIKTSDETIQFVREGDEWIMDEPVRDRADTAAIQRLLSTLEDLRSKAVLTDVDGGALKDFGLNKPEVVLEFEGKGAPPTLSFGNETAVEGGYYARIGDSKTVHVLENDLKSQLLKKPEAFRDPRLIGRRATEVERVTIRTEAGEIEMTREGDDWQLVKPFKARGDNQAIRDLIAKVTNARVQDFVSEPREGDGLAEPTGTLELGFAAREEPVTLKIGGPVDGGDGMLYAALSSRIGVYVVNKNVGDLLETRPDDMRDRNLARLNPDIIDRVTIYPAEGNEIVLARDGEEWAIRSDGGRPANAAQVMRLIDSIRNHRVRAFVADVASDLEQYGLKEPLARVTFSSYASENTAESQAGENEISTVAFGRPDGEPVFARLEEEPFIVEVDPVLLNEVRLTPSEWNSLSIFNVDRETLTEVEIQRGDAEPIVLTREGETWRAAVGTLDTVNAQSLVNTLSKLRAVRWIGPAREEHGLGNPALTIRMSAEDGSGRTLHVGNESPENMWFSSVNDVEGVFLLNRPDYEALSLPLVEGNETEATAAAPDAPEASPPAAVPAPPASPETRD